MSASPVSSRAINEPLASAPILMSAGASNDFRSITRVRASLQSTYDPRARQSTSRVRTASKRSKPREGGLLPPIFHRAAWLALLPASSHQCSAACLAGPSAIIQILSVRRDHTGSADGAICGSWKLLREIPPRIEATWCKRPHFEGGPEDLLDDAAPMRILRALRQLSSVVEQRFRKPQVPSSSLGVGSNVILDDSPEAAMFGPDSGATTQRRLRCETRRTARGADATRVPG